MCFYFDAVSLCCLKKIQKVYLFTIFFIVTFFDIAMNARNYWDEVISYHLSLTHTNILLHLSNHPPPLLDSSSSFSSPNVMSAAQSALSLLLQHLLDQSNAATTLRLCRPEKAVVVPSLSKVAPDLNQPQTCIPISR